MLAFIDAKPFYVYAKVQFNGNANDAASNKNTTIFGVNA
jgi:hypothetical protein